jgi:RNA recognition motif-containing protein
MATKLFVGSLSYNVDDNQLRELFATIGEVTSATVITDRDSGQSKGFGFVEMSSDKDAQEAIKQLNNKDLDGRSIIVNVAKPREDKPRGGGSFRSGPDQNRGRSSYSNNRRY